MPNETGEINGTSAASKSESRVAGKTAKKRALKAARKARKAEKKEQQKPWTFPKRTLEDAIRLAQAIEEKNAGKPIKASDLCKMVGYNNPFDWRFQDLLKSSNQYGLVVGSGAKATVELTDIANDIVAPSSPAQRQKALIRAFESVDQFKRVCEFYAGKHLPEDEYFGNTIVREFQVPRDRVEPFTTTFVDNLVYLKAFVKDDAGKRMLLSSYGGTEERKGSDEIPGQSIEKDAKNVRQFLDTCFVLMPFGEWFDRYFNEIYIPACKDANMEAIRADGLFSTGAVMEQIWEQIKKAKVLLAELTGKNPNVFYELGLAHALRKPVVFISADLEDVPFDLRHLRVVIYDVREPKWDEKLRQKVATYLRNAKADPDKSIPQPFRGLQAAAIDPLE